MRRQTFEEAMAALVDEGIIPLGTFFVNDKNNPWGIFIYSFVRPRRRRENIPSSRTPIMHRPKAKQSSPEAEGREARA
jgi:hypothetical protein